MGHYPDPILTANVYAAGHLDRLIAGPIVSFWQRHSERLPGGVSYLWIMRHQCRGEHLKIRVHGEPAIAGESEQLLRKTVTPFLASLPHSAHGGKRRASSIWPPIDVEDWGKGLRPDRSLLFTHYQRSHVAFGGEPFLSDETCVAAMTRCLGAGCELVLDAAERHELLPHRAKHDTLLEALAAGLAALDLDDERLRTYLTYHRDSLICLALFKARSSVTRAAALLKRFEKRADQMESTIAALSAALKGGVAADSAADEQAASLSQSWGVSLRALYEAALGALDDYVDPLSRFRSFLDPIPTVPSFPPVFKALHGLANALGLKLLDEPFAHHLLLRAAGGRHLDSYSGASSV